MMDRAEWTRQIEAEVAELQRDLAETRTTAPERRSKKLCGMSGAFAAIDQRGIGAAQAGIARRGDEARRCRVVPRVSEQRRRLPLLRALDGP